MFAEGEYISYSCYGVCKVEGTTMMEVPGTAETRQYYVLKPIYGQNGTVYSPVDNGKALMRRKILTKEEANCLLEQTPQLELIQVRDKKQLEETCKQAVQSGECIEWLKVIKTLMHERHLRHTQGKKMTSTNERYLRTAIDKLCGELAVSLQQDKSRLEAFLEETLEKECAQ